MKCPYCESEMKAGFVQSGGIILWTEKARKFFLFPMKTGDIALSGDFWKGIPGFICKECKKVIIDYSAESEQDLGVQE